MGNPIISEHLLAKKNTLFYLTSITPSCTNNVSSFSIWIVYVGLIKLLPHVSLSCIMQDSTVLLCTLHSHPLHLIIPHTSSLSTHVITLGQALVMWISLLSVRKSRFNVIIADSAQLSQQSNVQSWTKVLISLLCFLLCALSNEQKRSWPKWRFVIVFIKKKRPRKLLYQIDKIVAETHKLRLIQNIIFLKFHYGKGTSSDKSNYYNTICIQTLGCIDNLLYYGAQKWVHWL